MSQIEVENGSNINDVEQKRNTPTQFMNGLNDVKKLKIPSGNKNYQRLSNISMGDLLSHIQQKLSIQNKCILELITNEPHPCIKNNNEIHKAVMFYAKQFINKEICDEYPRCINESDDDYTDRLCHMIMLKHHPYKLQMIHCEYCIQKWMNDSKW